MNVMLESNIAGLPKPRRGKVRDVYDLGERLLIVTTDRISAFDCIFPNGIPHKGRVLNTLALYWFGRTRDIVENHVISDEASKVVPPGTPLDDLRYEFGDGRRNPILWSHRVLLDKSARPQPVCFRKSRRRFTPSWQDGPSEGGIEHDKDD